MKKMLLIIMSLVMFFTLSHAAYAGTSWRDGKKIFKQSCMSCHKASKEGGRLKINEHGLEFWSKCVKAPKDVPHMEVMKSLTDDETEALLKYLFKYANGDESEKRKKS